MTSTLGLVLIKIAGLFSLLLLTGIGLILPLFLKRLRSKDVILSLSNVFSGGVFLGTSLCHLLPDAIVEFDDKFGAKTSSFPIIELVFGLTLLLFILIDNVIFPSSHSHSPTTSTSSSTSSTSSFAKSEHILIEDPPEFGLSNRSAESNLPLSEDDSENCLEWPSGPIADLEGNFKEDSPEISPVSAYVVDDLNNTQEHHSPIGAPAAGVDIAKPTRPVIAFVLSFMLSIHSLVEGLAFGIQSDSKTTLLILVVLVAHKGIEAFALSTNLVKGNLSPVVFTSFSIPYALMTPLGIFIGLLVSSLLSGNVAVLATSIFTGTAGGTFLYVGLMEMVMDELKEIQSRLMLFSKWSLIVIGFLIFALLALWA